MSSWKRVLVGVVVGVIGSAAALEAQSPVQSLAPSARRASSGIPEGYRPPAGMCRVWIDNVAPGQQPAPTDCASAIRNRPTNARVVFSEGGDGDGRDLRPDRNRRDDRERASKRDRDDKDGDDRSDKGGKERKRGGKVKRPDPSGGA